MPDPAPEAPACDVSVIVVNWNTCAMTGACLTSVTAATRGCRYELIVVDNGSTDGSAERLSRDFPQAVLVRHGRNLGFAAGCNSGLSRARGRHMLLLNSDTLLEEDVVSRLAGVLDADPAIGLAGAGLRYPDGRLQPSCGTFPSLARELTSLVRVGDLLAKLRGGGTSFPAPFLPYADHATERDVDWVAGACMLVRREALQQVGSMDADIFLFAEEWDWCRRLHAAGWRVRHVPHAALVHVGSASMVGDAAWRVRALLDGYHYFFRKHGGRAQAAGFRLITAVASSFKCAAWGLLALLLLPWPAARGTCVRRCRWNGHSVLWALRPGAEAARRSAHAATAAVRSGAATACAPTAGASAGDAPSDGSAE